MIRIGHGFDVHRFTDEAADSHVTLGGVRIQYSHGLQAHSDGDVLIHAVCDAVLGAAALGDIGQHFPDTDDRYKGIDSRQLLCHVVALIHDKGFHVINMDSTIVAQVPRMAPHIPEMRENMAKDLRVELGVVNVKATTTEKLGYIGHKEGIAVHAVVLLGSANNPLPSSLH